ncbi:hypothetical protein [Acidiphilium acidophilum]|uniref:Uncharacterized protein n=1 Tax=Acidiphilium acidophilum TaxID=76588 RepID=A0AAW9DU57_ACIAO|nr:hypothetical protein [Acidiphilium acidophilum]MDX5932578.1 hypothetical protein [Acidiphilium acidophilum]
MRAGRGNAAGLGALGLDAGEQVAQAGGEAGKATVEQQAERGGQTCGTALHLHAGGGDGLLQAIYEARETGEEG